MNQQEKKQTHSSEGPILSKEVLDDFRETGPILADYLVDQFYSQERKPAMNKEAKIEYSSPPQKGKQMEDIFEDYKNNYAHLSSDSQNMYNLKPYETYSTLASAVGDMFGFTVGSPMFTWIASPMSTELEILVTDELARKLKLPEKFFFDNNGLGIVNFCQVDGMLAPVFAAKHEYMSKHENESPPPFVVYLCDTPDFIFIRRNLELADFVVKIVGSPESLIELIKKDSDSGLQPLFVSLTYPRLKMPNQVYDYCNGQNIWMHCDTQDMGPLSLLPEFEEQVKEYEHYSSLSLEGGYWLGTGMETSLMWVVQREKIKEALEFPFLMKKNVYLKTENQKTGYDINYKDYQVHLGRRMRSLKLWSVFNVMGAEGLRQVFRQRIKFMKSLEQKLKSHPDQFDSVYLPKPHELRFKLKTGILAEYVKKLGEKGIQIGVEESELVAWVNPFKMEETVLAQIAEDLINSAE